MLEPHHFFDLDGHRFAPLFEGATLVWEALDQLASFLRDQMRPNVAPLRRAGDLVSRTVVLWQGQVIEDGFRFEVGDVKRGGLKVFQGSDELAGASVVQAGTILCSDDIEIGAGSWIEGGAYLKGPTVIGDHTEVRQGAYVRGRVLVGDGCVVGHATEVKSSIMLGGSQAGHFAYLGDSILGKVNLGAGTKLANLKVFHGSVGVTLEGRRIDTGRRKLGAIIGDGAELGCNSVTTPGTLLGRNTVVYPNVTVRGYHAPGTVVKHSGARDTAEDR